jgi:hypothetical protein
MERYSCSREQTESADNCSYQIRTGSVVGFGNYSCENKCSEMYSRRISGEFD